MNSVAPRLNSTAYLAQGADLEAVAKLHKASLPAHRVPGCLICQSLYERRAELVSRYFGSDGPPGMARLSGASLCPVETE
jgi:hypothetical protein